MFDLPTDYIISCAIFLGGLYLGWRCWTTYRSGQTTFPVVRLERVSRVSDSGSFWLAVLSYALLAVVLTWFGGRAIF
jgi:hypothetical protein